MPISFRLYVINARYIISKQIFVTIKRNKYKPIERYLSAMFSKREREFIEDPKLFEKEHGDGYTRKIKFNIRRKMYESLSEIFLVVQTHEGTLRSNSRKHPKLNLGRKGKGILPDKEAHALYYFLRTIDHEEFNGHKLTKKEIEKNFDIYYKEVILEYTKDLTEKNPLKADAEVVKNT